MRSPDAPERCLLCDGRELRALWTITGRELRLLFAATGAQHSDAAFGRITPDFPVRLFECAGCGFQFFNPALAGAGEFYAEAESPGYYPAVRREFEMARAFATARGLRSVLDVGGGDGAFLDLARRAGLRTYGCELNAHAAAIAAEKGHTMLGKPLPALTPEDVAGGVDVMTFFQVVEHLPDPRRFLAGALHLLRPGGFIIITVPNRNGCCRLTPFDPANMPPHHITRWRSEDLARLGRACGLRVESIGAETLFAFDIERLWKLHNRFAAAIGKPPRPGGGWLPGLLTLLYRYLGARHWFPRRGFGVYAIFQRT